MILPIPRSSSFPAGRLRYIAAVAGITLFLAATPTPLAGCNYGTFGLTPGENSQTTVDDIFRGKYKEFHTLKAREWTEKARLIADQATDLPGKLDLAWALAMAGDRQKSINIYEDLLKTHPGNYEVLCSYGAAMTALRQYPRARQLIQQAVELKPGFRNRAEEYHLNMLDYEIQSMRDPGYARDNLFVPELTPIWKNRKGIEQNLSTVVFPKGFNSQGMAELLRQYPEYGEAWLALGMLLEHEEDFSMAAKAYDRALEHGTAHRDDLRQYMATFREFGREHDSGRVVARGIKRLLIILAALAVLFFLYRIAARVIWDVTSHRAMKQEEARRKRRKEDRGPL